jgi:filamentous hemagglutinin family protein
MWKPTINFERQTRMKRTWPSLLKTSLLLPVAAIGTSGICLANPTGGTITAGSATIASSNKTMTIDQATNKLAINWSTFNIASGESLNFVQPSSSSIAVNRVIGNNPSSIYGSLNANGAVFLLNPSGVLFGKGSSVNVGGLVASTLSLSDADFLSGNYHLTGSGGLVLNRGTITAADGGYVALLGGQANNDGVIVANAGTVALAGGNAVTLDFAGDGFLHVAVDQAALAASVENSGVIAAKGGKVYLTAQAAEALASTVVNNSGVIEAQSIGNDGGTIVLDGSASGTVVNSGTLDTSGSAVGGTVKVFGDTVDLAPGTKIDVSGDLGGGTALIGGAAHGGSSEPSATNTNVASGIVIDASANTSGNGGNVVVWSNGDTSYAGDIFADGGAEDGNGGSVEVSGKQTLEYNGLVSTLAANGLTGSLLLDPGDYTIDSSNVGALETTLNSTNTTISSAANGDGSGPGDIDVNAPVSWTAATTLTVDADNNININSAISAPNGGLTLNANDLGGGVGTITDTAPLTVGSFTLQNGAWTQNTPALPAFATNSFALTGGTFLRVVAGDGSSGNPYQISDLFGLQGVEGFLSDDFELANNIDATQSATFNGNAGFIPIGSSLSPYGGTFNGQGFAINNLTINQSGTNIGLFGASDGTIENVALTNENVTDNGQIAGGLVGSNLGFIGNSSSSGTITDIGGTNVMLGGVAGYNDGSISGSSSVDTVSLTGSSGGIDYVGGLIGENDSLGSIDQSSAGGSVSFQPSTGEGIAGGLVGLNYGAISTGDATGNVSDNTPMALSYLGGLVGENGVEAHSGQIASISDSIATGTVTASAGYPTIGGLVGANDGEISGSDATGAVTDASSNDSVQFVGGLIGDSDSNSSVFGCYSTGAVTNSSIANGVEIGGLIGSSSGLVDDSYSTGSLIDSGPGEDQVGGLIGDSAGSVLLDYSTSSIVLNGGGNNTVGDLVGIAGSTVDDSYATGAIDVQSGGRNVIGELVGRTTDTGVISTCYAYGNVTDGGTAGGSTLGGLVGTNQGSITNSYSTGNVTDNTGGPADSSVNDTIGGLVGTNEGNENDGAISANSHISDSASGGIITTSYSTGAVTSTNVHPDQMGGLVGINYGSITSAYWDTTTSGLTTGIGSEQSSGDTDVGLTAAEMMQSGSFNSDWSFNGTWRVYNGFTDPLLEYFLTPVTVTIGGAVTYNGAPQSPTVTYTVTERPVGLPAPTSISQLQPIVNTSLIFGSLVTMLNGSPTSSAINAGTYSVNTSGLYSNQQGYDIGYTSSPFVINPKALTYNVANAVSTYGTLAVPGSVTLSGVFGVDIGKVSGVEDITGENGVVTLQANTPTGDYTESVTGLIGSASGNYTLASTGNFSGGLQIDPKALMVTVNNATKVQGAANPSFTSTLTGLVAGDTPSSVGTIVYTTSATTVSPVGQYSIIPSGLSDFNYNITYVNGVLTITSEVVSTPYLSVATPAYFDAITYANQTHLGTLPSPDYWPLTIVWPGVNIGETTNP